MRIAVAFVVGTVAVVIAACSSPADPPPQAAKVPMQSASTASAPATPQAPMLAAPGDPRFIEADLPLLPDNLPYAVRPIAYEKEVFTFAAKHGDVLRYIPCFCGCERMGHHANDECFVAKRSATGRVTEWQPHGVICEICLDVAHQAKDMFEAGAPIDQIRRAVDTKWSTATGSHTNTMMPPHSGGH